MKTSVVVLVQDQMVSFLGNSCNYYFFIAALCLTQILNLNECIHIVSCTCICVYAPIL
jgi:hypothetical protein